MSPADADSRSGWGGGGVVSYVCSVIQLPTQHTSAGCTKTITDLKKQKGGGGGGGEKKGLWL